MLRRPLTLGCVALACLSVGARSPSTDWTVYLRRAGPVRIGMTLPEIRRAIGDSAASADTGAECTYLDSDRLPEHLGFMMSDGLVVRVDVYSPSDVRTGSGAGIGDSEARVLSLYGAHIKIEPHPYDPDHGHYLISVPTDSTDRQYEMIFETGAGKVEAFRAGLKSAVDYIEGCS